MILLDGKLMSEAEASVSALAEGFQFGAGVFTTVRVRAGRAEFIAEHAERLAGDARALGLVAASSVEGLRERCAVCIATNRIVEGGIKIVWFADRSGRTGEVVSQRAHRYDADALARGFRLMTSGCGSREHRELSRHKTLNYLEHLRARRAAVEAGFDEALWVDEHGRVLEGATTNIFAVIDSRLVTPDASAGLLPGVARRVVLGLGGENSVDSVTLTREMLARAEEIFVTNALMGVMPVRALDNHTYDSGRNRVTRRIAALFAQAAALR
jgi:branched-subunit amino acid aminotransferase/4-amino-4-deoxychorismate lyase